MKFLASVFQNLTFLCLSVALSLFLGAGLNLVRAHPLPWKSLPPDKFLVAGIPGANLAGGAAVSAHEIDDAARMHDQREVLFVDAREKAFFYLGHIPGAVNLPRSAFREEFPAFQRNNPATRALIVYCSDRDCEDGMVVARALVRLGYRDVGLFAGGWEEWSQAGLATEP